MQARPLAVRLISRLQSLNRVSRSQRISSVSGGYKPGKQPFYADCLVLLVTLTAALCCSSTLW